MQLENLLLEISEGIATVTVNRPTAMNAMNISTLRELEAAVEEIVRNPDIRAAILTGAGTKAFVAGADIAVMRDMTSTQARDLALQAHRIYAALKLCKEAVGNGLEMDLARACAYKAELFGYSFSTTDQKEGMGAFLEKRPAVFRDC